MFIDLSMNSWAVAERWAGFWAGKRTMPMSVPRTASLRDTNRFSVPNGSAEPRLCWGCLRKCLLRISLCFAGCWYEGLAL